MTRQHRIVTCNWWRELRAGNGDETWANTSEAALTPIASASHPAPPHPSFRYRLNRSNSGCNRSNSSNSRGAAI